MNLKQFDECAEIVDWRDKNSSLLLRAGLSPSEIVNICEVELFPSGPASISDIAMARIVEVNFI